MSADRRRLEHFLLSAFPTRADVERLLRSDRRLTPLVADLPGGTPSHRQLCAAAIDAVAAHGLFPALVDAILEARPHREHEVARLNLLDGTAEVGAGQVGVRIGTPALTTRGMGPDEMKRVGGWIAEVLKNVDDEAAIKRVRGEIEEMTASYPLFKQETD